MVVSMIESVVEPVVESALESAFESVLGLLIQLKGPKPKSEPGLHHR